MTDAAIPEPDRAPGAPHPRETGALIGQDRAEAAFLGAYNSGRLHHGWMITGPKGVGKATLAWRIARFLLSQPQDDGPGLFGDAPAPDTLDTDPDSPIAKRLRAMAEQRAFVLRRGWDEKLKRLKHEITVDEARKLQNFFHLSAPDGGWRVVIVDAADELNLNAANALLKLLEEPPARTVLLLIAHQPSRLLPTIRSRCRTLACAPLGAADMARALAAAGLDELSDSDAVTVLAGGSVGRAIRIVELGGVGLYADLVALIGQAPAMDRQAAIALAEKAGARGQNELFELALDLLDTFLARLARAGIAGVPANGASPDEATVLARLAPDAARARGWAELQQTLGARARRGRAVNLDPASLLLDTLLKINEAARDLAA